MSIIRGVEKIFIKAQNHHHFSAPHSTTTEHTELFYLTRILELLFEFFVLASLLLHEAIIFFKESFVKFPPRLILIFYPIFGHLNNTIPLRLNG